MSSIRRSKFIVLGYTAGRCSIEIIDRYKSDEDLRDIFEVDGLKIGRAIRRKLNVFEVCSANVSDCLWLISFDIKMVRVRDGVKSYRKPSHEYSIIKEMLFTSLCGSIDLSTYICFTDMSGVVRDYLLRITDSEELFRVKSYYVRPYRDVDKELVIESIKDTIEWLESKTLSLVSKISSVAPQGFGQVRKKVKELIERLKSAIVIGRIASKKLEMLGVNVNLEKIITDNMKKLEEALELRESKMKNRD
jgi:hypothetical protein